MIAERLHDITRQLPDGVNLVAVSKFHPAEQVREAYDAGQRLFGESRVQELVAKAPLLPPDIEWHFIGHLQKNKVRQLMPVVTMIHSIDSLALLQRVNDEARRIDRHVDVLLQLHVAQEETKSGFYVDELLDIARQGHLTDPALTHVTLRGLMAMATFTDDTRLIDSEFQRVSDTFNTLRPLMTPDFDTLSMGMSDDWPIALQHGATLIRIGTQIFGPRQY